MLKLGWNVVDIHWLGEGGVNRVELLFILALIAFRLTVFWAHKSKITNNNNEMKGSSDSIQSNGEYNLLHAAYTHELC